MCKALGCDRTDHHAKGFCNKHYQRFCKHGDPLMLLKLGQPLKFNSLLENFESRFKKGASNHCWLWDGALDKDGYGVLSVWENEKYKRYRAHRLSYMFYVEDIPNDAMVCHKCDNPTCLNPYHLFLGTAQDNATDMIQKRRSMFGSSNNKAKLTEATVKIIKQELHVGCGNRELAKKYNVHEDTIGRIKRKISWKHLG